MAKKYFAVHETCLVKNSPQAAASGERPVMRKPGGRVREAGRLPLHIKSLSEFCDFFGKKFSNTYLGNNLKGKRNSTPERFQGVTTPNIHFCQKGKFSLTKKRFQGFYGGSDGRICLHCRRPRFNPWVGKIPLEKGMATHSSILAWRILWTEEAGEPQSMGLQRVEQD